MLFAQSRSFLQQELLVIVPDLYIFINLFFLTCSFEIDILTNPAVARVSHTHPIPITVHSPKRVSSRISISLPECLCYKYLLKTAFIYTPENVCRQMTSLRLLIRMTLFLYKYFFLLICIKKKFLTRS